MPESPADTNAVLSINQLLDTAERLAQTQGITELWWRGHSLATWPLTPGVYRNGRDYAYETAVCARFHRKAPTRYSNCPPNTDLSGWLFLMQHYGLPTRLLDWSESCLVAMFFAATEHPGEDGALWVLNPFKLNETQVGRPVLVSPSGRDATPLFRAPLMDGQPQHPDKQLAILAIEMDARMLIQQSAFTIHGSGTPLDTLSGAEAFLQKIVVPAASKRPICTQLGLLGISLHTLFPDLEHLARDLARLSFTAKEETRPLKKDDVPPPPPQS